MGMIDGRTHGLVIYVSLPDCIMCVSINEAFHFKCGAKFSSMSCLVLSTFEVPESGSALPYNA